jgi:hypothetical protein
MTHPHLRRARAVALAAFALLASAPLLAAAPVTVTLVRWPYT